MARTAFVLGGGGVLGAHEVGMLRALDEAGIRPDLVVGTSVGALNGAVIAAAPADAVARLTGLWQSDVVR
ncbi:patatin-like phospholipase family protein, partial [Nonomuraea sp. MG754425]|uniref:patatin-like phospholipase family protein n=1 Tax=Nonomuraea sp. MG754425 TaxID=2570319 RepID=UPI001F000763